MAIERIIPGTKGWDAYYSNHICRYEFAEHIIDKIKTNNILDAACGVGYGSKFLSQKNPHCQIVSIDRSDIALSLANSKFSSPQINYIEDDCHTLAEASKFGPFDAIVSFETLEHLPYPEKFIQSCYSNLSKEGHLIISTPNQLVSSPTGELNWEFHEKEYKPQELKKILFDYGFTSIELYGQQLTPIGKLREQIRAEFNKTNSNPFIRIGRKIQKLFKGHDFLAVLPEQIEDFEIKKYDSVEDINKLGTSGPFVLIAVCKKI